ncbi:CDP-4-dehydro-6-deoxyglucose reductase, E3 [Gammaproteobacteria bacterium]
MSFVVHIESSGREITVEPEETVLDAALRQGVHLPYSCRGGLCGVCKATLLMGDVDYGPTTPSALSLEEQKVGMALLCRAIPRSDLHLQIREVKQTQDIQVRILPCRLEKKELLAPDVLRLFLRLPASDRLPFLPGQYIEFLLPNNRRRAFSLANTPHHDELLELHVRHVSGGSFTTWLFQELSEKPLLRIQGPLGSFTFQEDSERPAILMAGGTGFAPVKSILEYAFAEGIERPLHLYWGARARCDLYLDELPRLWMQQYSNFRYTPVLSAPTAEDAWEGRTGLVHAAIAADYPDLSRHEVYACGPPPMTAAGLDAFAACGLPREYYYSDAFEYAKDSSGTVSA